MANPYFTWADGTRITQDQLAEILGVSSARQVRRYLQDESAPKDTLANFVEWKYTRDFGLEVELDEEKTALLSKSELMHLKLHHDTRKAEYEANRSKINEEKEQFDLEVMRGDYVLKDVVIRNLMTASRVLSDLLFAFPERIITRIMGSDDQREVLDVIDTELRTITEEVAQVEVIPE